MKREIEKEKVSSLFVNIAYTTTSLLQRGRSPSVSVRLTVNYNHDRCVTSIMATVAGWRSANSSERRKQRYRSTGISFILAKKKIISNAKKSKNRYQTFLSDYLIITRDLVFVGFRFFFSIIFLSFSRRNCLLKLFRVRSIQKSFESILV